MNYIKLMNAFEDYSDRTGLPAYAQLIYYKLFAMNNRAGWVEWFETTNPYLMFKTGIKDEGTFIRHRNTLKQCELIDFISGKKSQPTRYKLIKLYTDEENTGLNPVNMPANVPVNMPVKTPPIVPVKMPDIYKDKLNINQNKNINNSEQAQVTVDNFLGEVCSICKGQGRYVVQVPFNNGLSMRDEVVVCECMKKKPPWASGG